MAYEKTIPQSSCIFLLSLDDYYLDKKNRLFVHAGFTNMNGVAYEFFSKTILLGQNPLGNCLVTRPKHQTNDLLYPKRLTLYDEIYIRHTPLPVGKLKRFKWLVSGM
jgi:serine/threonine protein phosphatase 1